MLKMMTTTMTTRTHLLVLMMTMMLFLSRPYPCVGTRSSPTWSKTSAVDMKALGRRHSHPTVASVDDIKTIELASLSTTRRKVNDKEEVKSTKKKGREVQKKDDTAPSKEGSVSSWQFWRRNDEDKSDESGSSSKEQPSDDVQKPPPKDHTKVKEVEAESVEQSPSSSKELIRPSPPATNPSIGQSQEVSLAGIIKLIRVASAFYMGYTRLLNLLSSGSGIRAPVRHFIWERLNDKYVIDAQVWDRVQRMKPLSDTLFQKKGRDGRKNNSQRRWNRIVTDMTTTTTMRTKKLGITKATTSMDSEENDDVGPIESPSSSSDQTDQEMLESSSSLSEKLKYLQQREEDDAAVQTVIVVDMNMSKVSIETLTDTVSFLVSIHSRDVQNHQRATATYAAAVAAIEEQNNNSNKKWRLRQRQPPPPPLSYYHFGPNPEIVILLESPGGDVPTFGLCAEQINRLRDAGFIVTACVDRIAASGGYMMASQTSQIIAAPFAVLGSIGVIGGGVNFFELLKKYGIQSLQIKAGDQKNPISPVHEVTPKDLASAQHDAEMIHREFIDMCLTNRPQLDPAVCNGRTLFGQRALDAGMIDRILTSDAYIMEHISSGKSLVMKLHPVVMDSGTSSRRPRLLPYLRSKVQSMMSSIMMMILGGGADVGRLGGFESNKAPSDMTLSMGTTFPAFFSEHTTLATTSGDLNSMISNVIQGVALLSMIQRAVTRYQCHQSQK